MGFGRRHRFCHRLDRHLAVRAGLVLVGLLAVVQPSHAAETASPWAPVITRDAQECGPVPEWVSRVAARQMPLPDERNRDRLAGDALVSEAAKARALHEMIEIYAACRDGRR